MTDFLIRAAQFAAKAHEGQRRKSSGRPYIEHPMRVAGAMMLRPDVDKSGIGEQVVAAAWCHDVLEDTSVTVEELGGVLGPVATTIVVDLTHPPLSAGNRPKRQELYRKQLASASREVQLIKMLDRIDNLDEMWSAVSQEMDEGDASFAELYAHESFLLAEAIGRPDPALRIELINAAYRLLKSLPPSHDPETLLAEARKHGLKQEEESAFLMWVANECFEKREVLNFMVLEARMRELVLMFRNQRRPA